MSIAQMFASKLTHNSFACPNNQQIKPHNHDNDNNGGFASKVLIVVNNDGISNNKKNKQQQRVVRMSATRQENQVVPVTPEYIPPKVQNMILEFGMLYLVLL